MRTCPHCGTEVGSETYCPICGEKLPVYTNPVRPQAYRPEKDWGSPSIALGAISLAFLILGHFFLGAIFVPIAFVLSILSVVFGAKGQSGKKHRAAALGGLVTGIVALVLSSIQIIPLLIILFALL